MTQPKESTFDKVINPWPSKIIIGLLLFGVAVWAFRRYAAFEAGETAISMTRKEKVLYDLGGKWLAASVPGLCGVVMVAWGVVQVTRRRSKEPESR